MAFPSTLDSDFGTLIDSSDYPEAAHVNTLRRAVEGLEAKMGIDSSAVTSSIDYKVNNFFTSTRKLYLYENTAPTGWTIDSVTDKVLAVKGGTNGYNVSGGGLGGSFSISTANMPSHRHSISAPGNSTSNTHTYISACHTQYGAATFYTGYTGSSDGKYRPYAAVGIIAYNGNFI